MKGFHVLKKSAWLVPVEQTELLILMPSGYSGVYAPIELIYPNPSNDLDSSEERCFKIVCRESSEAKSARTTHFFELKGMD